MAVRDPDVEALVAQVEQQAAALGDLDALVRQILQDAGGDEAAAEAALIRELTARLGKAPLQRFVSTLLELYTMGGDVFSGDA